jgi:hypothetical protein
VSRPACAGPPPTRRSTIFQCSLILGLVFRFHRVLRCMKRLLTASLVMALVPLLMACGCVSSLRVEEKQSAEHKVPRAIADDVPPVAGDGLPVHALSDAKLRQRIDDSYRSGTGPSEECLVEIVRRGGTNWAQYLSSRLAGEIQPGGGGVPFFASLRDLRRLEALTALRRLEGKPDPLQIIVDGELSRSWQIDRWPVFWLAVVNLDVDKESVPFQSGGNYRSGRQARWRILVTDSNGAALPSVPPPSPMGGGLSVIGGGLAYGESHFTSLRLEDYVRIPRPGKYTMRFLYHDEVTIVERDDLSNLVYFSSMPISVTVEPIRVCVSTPQRERIRRYIQALPNTGPVVILKGNLLEHAGHLNPDSAAGRLRSEGTYAIPDMIEALQRR